MYTAAAELSLLPSVPEFFWGGGIQGYSAAVVEAVATGAEEGWRLTPRCLSFHLSLPFAGVFSGARTYADVC